MCYRPSATFFLSFVSLVLAASTGCASSDDGTGSRTLLHLADDDCEHTEEVCTASYPPRCYTVCADEAPPECIPEEICTASYPPMCRTVCAGDDGDTCEGVGVTSSDGAEFFICGGGDSGGGSTCPGVEEGSPPSMGGEGDPGTADGSEPGGTDGCGEPGTGGGSEPPGGGDGSEPMPLPYPA